MPGLRGAAVAVAGALLVAGGLAPAGAAAPAAPTTVTVHDGRTSAAAVDIAQVRLEASWYWDSEQSLRVTVPHGFRAGHRLTVWFDVDGDSSPDGRYDLVLRAPAHAGGRNLPKTQTFRVGGGWSGGTAVHCSASEGGPPVFNPVRRGQRTVSLALDLWSCVGVRPPVGSGGWRVAVALSKGRLTDTAPDHRGWSPTVAGWGPCDPSGGPC